jgi:hypothetical protein
VMAKAMPMHGVAQSFALATLELVRSTAPLYK